MASNNKWARLWQHWCHPRWRVERHLPTAALQQLGEAIGRSEQQHSGQIRFVIESRWHSADIEIRSLPPIPTAGLTLEDMPALMEQCREQMRECIEAMDRELLAQQNHRLPPMAGGKTPASNPNL